MVVPLVQEGHPSHGGGSKKASENSDTPPLLTAMSVVFLELICAFAVDLLIFCGSDTYKMLIQCILLSVSHYHQDSCLLS